MSHLLNSLACLFAFPFSFYSRPPLRSYSRTIAHSIAFELFWKWFMSLNRMRRFHRFHFTEWRSDWRERPQSGWWMCGGQESGLKRQLLCQSLLWRPRIAPWIRSSSNCRRLLKLLAWMFVHALATTTQSPSWFNGWIVFGKCWWIMARTSMLVVNVQLAQHNEEITLLLEYCARGSTHSPARTSYLLAFASLPRNSGRVNSGTSKSSRSEFQWIAQCTVGTIMKRKKILTLWWIPTPSIDLNVSYVHLNFIMYTT